ncbi:putative glucan endo-1 [Phytophthora citrophthora]|uniref:glucan endo-1,3-beta-D-glucosidase n=1 Tax=Phytophthora citrophthora TaxID=4793 RepID=A0AAD9G522_9STRA|nr:putative glucan endo-1 [Phytophthora citrophthora]
MRFLLAPFVASVVLLLSSNADALNVKFPGVNYIPRKGPDNEPDNAKCKSASEMQKDLYALKGVTDKVRIYSLIDCNQAEVILPAAKKAGLKVDLGIWTTFNHDTLQKEKTKLAALIDSGLYDDNVVGFDVAIYMYEKFIANTAINYVKEIRDYLRSRGKNTPVTLADTVDVYNDNPQLVDAVDYVSVNYQSFAYGDDVNESVANTLDDLKDLRVLAAKKGKKFVISETGWSSSGFYPGVSVASPANQAKYFTDLYHVSRSHNIDFYWYFAFDTAFRSELENSFGVFLVNGTLKSNFQNLVIRQKEPRAIRNVGSKQLLSENNGSVYMSSKSSDWLVQQQQVWFFDSATQQVRSKSSDRCLDAYQGWNGGIVHVYRCMDNEANQKWTFEASTGKLKHAKHQGFCLDTDPAQNNKVQLYGCSPNNPNQQWSVINTSSI